jgi:hypothetical protein
MALAGAPSYLLINNVFTLDLSRLNSGASINKKLTIEAPNPWLFHAVI